MLPSPRSIRSLLAIKFPIPGNYEVVKGPQSSRSPAPRLKSGAIAREDERDWKLKLRYGKLSTDLSHFTVLADGVVTEVGKGFDNRLGPAWMAMKAWAFDAHEAIHMVQLIANHIGFSVTGRVHVYDTEPEVPPGEGPHGYGINFTPYDE